MYQIKINDYAEIITDDYTLNIKSYYQFIDVVDKITFVKDNGFVLEYNNKQYFIRFNKDELQMYKYKHYELLPYYYQKLVTSYHFKNEIIETNTERIDYLNMLYKNKPTFKNTFAINSNNTIKRMIDNKNIFGLIFTEFLLLKDLFKSIKDYNNELKNWENKIDKIQKLKVPDYAFQLNNGIDKYYIIEKMKNNNKQKNNSLNNIYYLYQYNEVNKTELKQDDKEDKIVSFDDIKTLIKKR